MCGPAFEETTPVYFTVEHAIKQERKLKEEHELEIKKLKKENARLKRRLKRREVDGGKV